MLYKTFKSILGPILRLVFRITVTGIENVPATGGVIIAANHQAVVDSFVIQHVIDRRVLFAAKQEYYQGKGLRGKIKKWFFSIGAFPIDRNDLSIQGLEKGLTAMEGVVLNGGALGIHPEGTRGPDSYNVYQGKASIVDVAWRTSVPIIPVALIGTRRANPRGWRFKFRARIDVVIGSPIVLKKSELRFVGLPRRLQMKSVMKEIARLGGMTYDDQDATKLKQSLLK